MDWWMELWQAFMAKRIKAEDAIVEPMGLLKELGLALYEGTHDPGRGKACLHRSLNTLNHVTPTTDESRSAIRQLRGELELLLGLMASSEGNMEGTISHIDRGRDAIGKPKSDREVALLERAEAAYENASVPVC